MYVYIYDTFVNDNKYSSVLAKIETRITDLGLNGKIVRLGPLSSFAESVRNEIKKGAKTIVVVGDDTSLSKAISVLAPLYSLNNNYLNIPLGFIPLGKKNNLIAPFLGLDQNEQACDMLAARRIEQLDLGLANQEYFLSTAQINTLSTIIEIDETYTIEVSQPGIIEIVNLPIKHYNSEQIVMNAKDGTLNLLIKTGSEKNLLSTFKGSIRESVFAFKEIVINNKNQFLYLDNGRQISCPAKIKLAKEKINLIVGKNRAI